MGSNGGLGGGFAPFFFCAPTPCDIATSVERRRRDERRTKQKGGGGPAPPRRAPARRRAESAPGSVPVPHASLPLRVGADLQRGRRPIDAPGGGNALAACRLQDEPGGQPPIRAARKLGRLFARSETPRPLRRNRPPRRRAPLEAQAPAARLAGHWGAVLKRPPGPAPADGAGDPQLAPKATAHGDGAAALQGFQSLGPDPPGTFMPQGRPGQPRQLGALAEAAGRALTPAAGRVAPP